MKNIESQFSFIENTESCLITDNKILKGNNHNPREKMCDDIFFYPHMLGKSTLITDKSLIKQKNSINKNFNEELKNNDNYNKQKINTIYRQESAVNSKNNINKRKYIFNESNNKEKCNSSNSLNFVLNLNQSGEIFNRFKNGKSTF